MINIESNNQIIESYWSQIDLYLKNEIEKILKNSFIKFKRIEYPISERIKSYLKHLIEKDNLKQLIICQPDELTELISSYENDWPDLIFRKNNNKEDCVFRTLHSVFYKNGYQKIDKFKFINDLNVKVCVYCNRNYITVSNKVRPQIDHFFPVSIYPFLACSYFNLIPCCELCNGVYGKHNIDSYLIGLKNPYLMSYNDFIFSFKFNDINFSNLNTIENSIEIVFKEKVNSNNDVFNLDGLYKDHVDHVSELIYKSKIQYSKSYRDYLSNYKFLNLNLEEINRLILGNYISTENLKKRPLTKLYKDISNELGLTNE
ncbi:MAG: hypothetical protein ACK476_15605 [Fluviicola sp.]